MTKTAQARDARIALATAIQDAIAIGLRTAATFEKEGDRVLCIEVALRQAGLKIVKVR